MKEKIYNLGSVDNLWKKSNGPLSTAQKENLLCIFSKNLSNIILAKVLVDKNSPFLKSIIINKDVFKCFLIKFEFTYLYGANHRVS